MQIFLNWLFMGGYAPYVFSAYALVITVFALHFYGLKRLDKVIKNKLGSWFESGQNL